MNKLLIICGPTATGKTDLALQIAPKYGADLISADSRQVYRGMDISTGKDLPLYFKFQISNFKPQQKRVGYYTDGKTNLWGLDLVDPDEEFSVADFVRFTVPVINAIWNEGKLPIIVGGTGLYIRALMGELPDIYIPRNRVLRKALEKKELSELQAELRRRDLHKFQSMNNSDRHNPRRLTRAIEVVSVKKDHNASLGDRELLSADTEMLQIGLTAPSEILGQRITQRVDTRLKQGIIAEIQKLHTAGYSWDLPAMSALGIRQWQLYFEKNVTLEEVRNKWILDEVSYAKRQLTWFKKESRVVWFDTSKPNYKEQAMEMIKKWYTDSVNSKQKGTVFTDH